MPGRQGENGQINAGISFRFVPMGTTAPKPVPENQIWLDVGKRAAPQVLDHHGGDTHAWSAAQLVFERYEEYILDVVDRHREIVLVLHEKPDLDAICAAWLTCLCIEKPGRLKTETAIEHIVDAVSEYDQGYVRTDALERWWPLVMKTRIHTQTECLSDADRVAQGMALFADSLAVLTSSGSLDHAADSVATDAVKALLQQASGDYQGDLSRGQIFQARLPRTATHVKMPQAGAEPGSPSADEWVLADAIFLENPTCALFKELARNDRQNSPGRLGFALLVVSRDLDIPGDRPLRRHIISTDPSTGLHLKGLAEALEAREQAREDAAALTPLPGRERTADAQPGNLRDAVPSPWYDGRGHNYTIVDSPAVRIKDHNVYASCLTSEEVLDAIRHFGRT